MNLRAGKLRRSIYALFSGEVYLSMAQIQAALPQYKKKNVAVTVYSMCNVDDELIVAGAVQDALAKGLSGFDGLHHRSYIYARAGMPPLREGGRYAVRTSLAPRRTLIRRPSVSGSCVVAPPPYARGYRW